MSNERGSSKGTSMFSSNAVIEALRMTDLQASMFELHIRWELRHENKKLDDILEL